MGDKQVAIYCIKMQSGEAITLYYIEKQSSPAVR
jgi:hypothetical protein